MRYKFKRIAVPGFSLVESRPELGSEHVKRFLPGTTPQNQATLNMYLSGSFSLEIPVSCFRCVMPQGTTNLDVELDAFPADVCIERPLEDGAWRMCLEPADKSAAWARRVDLLQPGSELLIKDNEVAIVLSGSAVHGDRAVAVGDVVVGGGVLSSSHGARLAIAWLL